MSSDSVTLTEGSGASTITVSLSLTDSTKPPLSDVVLNLSSNNNSDLTYSPNSLTFTSSNYGTAQTVTLGARADDDTKDETIRITFTPANTSGLFVSNATKDVSVADDDNVALTLSPSSLTITEGSTGTFTVKLATDPGENMSVSLTSNNSDVTLSSASLSFTASNWSTAQTVTVTAAEDNDSTHDSATISLSGTRITSGSLMVDVTDNDVEFDLSTTSLTVAEGGSATFTVKLNAQPTGDVTVTLAQPTNTANSDVTIADTDSTTSGNQNTLSFTTSNWDTAQTVTVNAAQDDDAVTDTATINLTAAGGGYDSVTGSVSVSVTEDETAGFAISATSLDVNENDSATFTVRLTSEPTASVTVTLAQPSNTANTDVTIADTDSSTNGNQNTLSFTTSNWDTAQTVTVNAAEDDDAVDDTATINLSATGGDYASATGSVSVTVDDDDEAGLTLSATTLSVTENSNNTFTVKLATEPTADVTVTLAQPTNSANSDVTFTPASLDFTTANWDTAQTVTVSAADDTDSTNDTAAISLTAAGGGYGSVTGNVSVNVTDDDEALVLSSPSLTVAEGNSATFTIKLARQPSAGVTVALAQPTNSTNSDVTFTPASLSFTTTDWNTDQTVTVSAAQDDDAVTDTATINLTAAGGGYDSVNGSVTVNVTDDETAGFAISATSLDVNENDSATFTVRLTSEPTASVTVTLAQPSNTANTDVTIADTDTATSGNQNTLSFTTSNWNTAQTVTVNAADDDDADDDTATINLTAAGGDYGSVTGSVSVTVDDDDMLRLTLTPANLTVNEGANGTFTVQLEALPSGDVTVSLAQGGTANADVTFTPASLDFTTSNWSTAQTVTVSAAQDADSAADRATINLSASGGGYDSVTGSVQITVGDDEDVGLTLTPAQLTIDEGGSATFTVQLANPTGSERMVRLESNNTDVTIDTDATTAGNQDMLTFAADGMNAVKTVTVTARQEADGTDREDGEATITFTGTGITAGSTLAVTVTDDDKGAPPEQEEEGATLQLATIAANLVPASSSTIALRFDAPRGARTATVAGRQIALDRSLVRDLAAGFAGRAGAQGAAQDRYEERRFGAERQSGEWLGGIALENGRPLRPGAERSSGSSGWGSLLSSFSYALGADASGSAGWSVWGRLDTGEFSGTSDGMKFDGSQSSTWFGFDRRTDGGILSGVAYSSSSSDSDYTLGRFGASIETDMSIVMPYMEIEDEKGSGHIMLGLVSGDATLNQTNRLQGSADLSMYLVIAGGNWLAAELGNSTLSWSGDFGFSTLKTSEASLTALDASVNNVQLRGGMELVHNGFGGSWTAMPRIGLLLRHDAGDGVTGTGIELTAGMQMLGASERLSVDLNLRTLTMHSAEDLSDWGAGLQLRLNSRSGGGGLEFAVGPTWGTADDDLLNRDDAFGLDEADRRSRQVRERGLAGNIGYGLRALGGMLTPYSEYRFTSGSNGSTRQVTGVRFNGSSTLELRLFSERHIAHRGEARSKLAVELQKRY